jgi:hypothetical protein
MEFEAMEATPAAEPPAEPPLAPMREDDASAVEAYLKWEFGEKLRKKDIEINRLRFALKRQQDEVTARLSEVISASHREPPVLSTLNDVKYRENNRQTENSRKSRAIPVFTPRPLLHEESKDTQEHHSDAESHKVSIHVEQDILRTKIDAIVQLSHQLVLTDDD